MSDSGGTSAPVAARGILVVLGAPNSYNFIYSRFPSTAGSGPSPPGSARRSSPGTGCFVGRKGISRQERDTAGKSQIGWSCELGRKAGGCQRNPQLAAGPFVLFARFFFCKTFSEVSRMFSKSFLGIPASNVSRTAGWQKMRLLLAESCKCSWT